MRIGMGFDIHPLAEGRRLILGGVEIPFVKGLDGYSDADVLLHAICDGLLGGAGLGDMGEHFPSSDPAYEGIASTEMLKEVVRLARKKGYRVSSIDGLILAEEPNLGPFKPKMRRAIGECLKLKEGNVNIKAATAKGLGVIGHGEAIAAYAVVLLEKKR